MADFTTEREWMVQRQIAGRGIKGQRLLDAFRTVPREAFVPEDVRDLAYEDGPLPIEAGQTISQPYIVALMIEAAEVAPGDRVLEVGAGSGYAAALMSRIADRVFAIERHASLAEAAKKRFEGLGYGNVELRTGDGTKGWPAAAPFDAIIVPAGGPGAPQSLKDQLEIGGRLVVPVGERWQTQPLLKIPRETATTFREEDLGMVAFVPLVGEEGWTEEGRRSTTVRSPGRPLPTMIAEAAEPLPEFDDPRFGHLFDRFADRRVVLLGEATHGTSEFYRARSAITRRL